MVKWFARRNNGIHQPEFRLIPLIIPICAAVIASVIYGQAGSHPEVFASPSPQLALKLTASAAIPLVCNRGCHQHVLLWIRRLQPDVHHICLGLVSDTLWSSACGDLRYARRNVFWHLICYYTFHREMWV